MAVDHDNNTVTCDINDSKDMQLTADFLANNEGFSVIGQDNNKGSSFSFSNVDEFNEFRANGVIVSFSNVEKILESNAFGIVMDTASSGLEIFGHSEASGCFGFIGGAVGISLTVRKALNDELDAYLQGIDTGIGLTGFLNPLAPLAYHYYYKPIMMKLAHDGAQFNCAFKKDPWGSFNNLMEKVSGTSILFGR